MKLMKRWTTTITSSFDSIISQIENHEALVNGALREMQEAGTKARIQLNRVIRDGKKMEQRIEELSEMNALWKERALKVHDEDKDKALECLRRKKIVEEEIALLAKQRNEHTALEAQLSKDLKLIAERIDELKRKRNILSAKEHRAQALKSSQLGELGLITEIDNIFDRWELRIGESELTCPPTDSLDDNFRNAEQEAELRDELAALIEESKQN